MNPIMKTSPTTELHQPKTTATGPLHAKNTRFFIDAITGRTVLLRGVNLSGSVKQPYTPRLPSHSFLTEEFFDHRNISFVGRPFPLDEADQHFARLHSWGFNFLRFNTTWEAIEHAGPGIYDHDYINYVVQILLVAKRYGFRVFIDPHQDVWSRHCGGSGAPGWSLDLVGLNPRNFASTNAAIVQNLYPDPAHYPKMIWATNYYKLAAATMFTLFFAGRIFAPNCLVSGVNIQDFLQSHYLGAVTALAKAIHATPGLESDVVVGYDTLNEPSSGYIGCEDITKLMESQELRKGLTPTPLQTMLLGAGIACQNVQVWDVGSFGPTCVATQTVDPHGIRAWHDNIPCIWADHGVWDPLSHTVLKPDYFSKHPTTGKHINFLTDAWMPFIQKFATGIRSVHSSAIIFVEPPVNAYPPSFSSNGEYGSNSSTHALDGPLCFAPHWYDGLTLITKHFNTWYGVDYLGFLRGQYSSIAFAVRFGEAGVRSTFKSQLKLLQQEGLDQMGNYPCVVGEIGIPYDMDNRHAYLTGDYSAQIQALDANMNALERNLMNFTLWNYCSDNNNLWGDQWNGEDLSIWAPPIAMVVAKEVEKHMYDSETKSNLTADVSTTASSSSKVETLTFSTDGVVDPSSSKSALLADELYSGAHEGSTLLDAGARALTAFTRPFAIQTPGTPIAQDFNLNLKQFVYTFEHSVDTTGAWIGDPRLFMNKGENATTEIYLPRVHFFNEIADKVRVVQVWVSHGVWDIKPNLQRCIWSCGCKPSSTLKTSNLDGDDMDESRGVIQHTIRISAISRSIASHLDEKVQASSGSKLVLFEEDPEQGRAIRSIEDEESMELCPQCNVM
ncbi:hypothetical protein O5D80_003567 [Batrachochytrium dendrobatidis]|nr:hypothetical protein O5D80_003567 [Batrachochytrium dendrobatidis]